LGRGKEEEGERREREGREEGRKEGRKEEREERIFSKIHYGWKSMIM
jgi:hypothetical protein